MTGSGTLAARPSVLIVEDAAETARVFAQGLRLAGYAVHVAGDGAAALRLIAERGFDALLLDLNLPEMSGIELLRQIREEATGGAIPAAVITGNYFLDAEDGAALAQLGAPVYHKPLRVPEVVGVVARLVSGAAAARPDA